MAKSVMPESVESLPNSPGVYLLTHRVTNDTYVGSSLDVRRRVRGHLCSLRAGCHENKGLLKLCLTSGFDLEAKLLEETTEEMRLIVEAKWVHSLRPSLNRRRMSANTAALPTSEPKFIRFLVQGTEDVHKRLQHLAIDLDTSAEKLAGRLLAEAVERAEAELRAGKRKPKSDA